MDTHLLMGRKNPKTLLDNPVVPLSGEPKVVDFQATRCSLHVQELQSSLRGLAEDLATSANCTLSDLSYLEDESEGALMEDVFAVFDFVDFKTSRRKKMLRATWAPFVLFSHGEQVLALRATYDVNGARVSGVSLTVDGNQHNSRCRKLSVARKILLSHIKTYVHADEQEV